MISSLLDIITIIMEVKVTGTNDESGSETIENWDSFCGLILFEELETIFSIEFTRNELLNIKKIKDIKGYKKDAICSWNVNNWMKLLSQYDMKSP